MRLDYRPVRMQTLTNEVSVSRRRSGCTERQGRRGKMDSKYATDFFGWATEQAELLRAGRLAEADIGNIAEEIESMGRGEKRELVNRLAVLLAHLLKWQLSCSTRST